MIQRTPAPIEARDPEADSAPAPTSIRAPQSKDWQAILKASVTRPEQLLERLGLSAPQWLDGAEGGHSLFPVRVPEPFLQRMEYGNPDDPLLRQVLPRAEETRQRTGFVQDPLAEDNAIAGTGLIRKYQSRALLMVTGQCAINCRYCFRRHFPYDSHRLGPGERRAVIEALTASPDINEVIFSGGDPLAVNDRLLARWAGLIEEVPHIRRLRIHSRLPVVIPQRVCDELLAWLTASRLQVVLVLHINHPAEIDQATRSALARLRGAGVTLLNQSVVLRGVNDSTDTLCQLSEALFEAGVMPYYLHAFDPVEGAHHFDVSDQEAAALVRGMLSRLPGFLVPKLVREIPCQPAKTPLNLWPEASSKSHGSDPFVR